KKYVEVDMQMPQSTPGNWYQGDTQKTGLQLSKLAGCGRMPDENESREEGFGLQHCGDLELLRGIVPPIADRADSFVEHPECPTTSTIPEQLVLNEMARAEPGGVVRRKPDLRFDYTTTGTDSAIALATTGNEFAHPSPPPAPPPTPMRAPRSRTRAIDVTIPIAFIKTLPHEEKCPYLGDFGKAEAALLALQAREEKFPIVLGFKGCLSECDHIECMADVGKVDITSALHVEPIVVNA
ncbi:hypothetical protein HK102_013258, partial [Quaeritorhiza haematococci]